MKIYVASSWRNQRQPIVVNCLRHSGHDVYDFRKDGFGWHEVDANWEQWTAEEYVAALTHEHSIRGFNRDMKNLMECDVCIMIMPCGPSASMEMGWAVGAGKKVAVYIPATREPDLMVKMADLVTNHWMDIEMWLVQVAHDLEETSAAKA